MVAGHFFKMLFWMMVGGFSMAFGVIILFWGMFKSNIIIQVIGIIIAVMGILIMWYFGHAHSIELRPHYRTRTKYIDY